MLQSGTVYRRVRLILQFVAISFFAQSLFAQTQAVNGSIRGRITDQSGGPVGQASVSVENTQTGFSRSADTADDGYYVFANLPLGAYSVSVRAPGFKTEKHTGINLDAGSEAVIDAELKVGSTSTSIEVTGGAPVIDPSRTNIGRVISHAEVDNLPLTSRNPYNFVLFQPGISGHPNQELGIPRLLNTNGLTDRVNYQLDGMAATESDRYGLRLFPIADIYVGEVQTVSNSFAPEFGLTAGDIYNVITGSGTNQFHGEVQYIGRPTDASARSILLGTNPKPDLTLSDTSFNVGGAIIKDKLFLFGAYEHVTRGVPAPVTISPANAAQLGIASKLLATPDSVQHAHFADLRADWQITEKHQLFVRLNYFRNQFPFNTNVGGLYALDTSSDFQDRAYIGSVQLLSSFSPNVLNELRVAEPYRHNTHVANSFTNPGPMITIPGIANFGGSNAIDDFFAEKNQNLNDNFTIIKGAHTFKAGGGFQHILDNQLNDLYSQYTFPSIQAYLGAKSGATPFSYSTFNTVIGAVGAGYHSLFWDWFAQDSWQARPNLLVTYGVRYDRFQPPSPAANEPFLYTQNFRTPGANFAPRLGLAWSVAPKTVIRVSSGVFYEAPPTNTWYNPLSQNGGNSGFVASFLPGAQFAPAFPQVFNAVSTGFTRTPSIFAVTPNFKNGYTFNSSFQVTQQLSSNDAITVGYVNTGARNLEYLRNLNVGSVASYLADGRPIFSSANRPYPQFNGITLQDIGADASYNALEVNYQHRWSKGYQVAASYTWSHAITDAPEANAYDGGGLLIEDASDRRRDRGNSLVNRPSAATISSVVAPTFHFDNGFVRHVVNGNQLTFLTTLESGDQQNIVGNRVLNGDPLVGSVTRPLFIGRNTVRGPSVYQLDVRYTRTLITLWDRFKPQFWAEANNVLNHPNITVINANASVDANGFITKAPTFAPVSTTLEGRIIQLGIRADW
jgi:hypothetical protein